MGNRRLNVLLFSPKGAGNHYYGPGMNAHRMYQGIDKKVVSLSLAHGYREQETLELFDEQYFISDVVNRKVWTGVNFLISARKWVMEHARQFDVVHVLTSFHHSFMFALWFEREGVPAVIKIGQSDHTGFDRQNSLFSKVAGLNRFRVNHANDITRYIAISSEIRNNLENSGIESSRIVDIPNGVDIERFKPADSNKKKEIRNKLGLEDRFTVIFTGAFSGRKNPLLAARGFRQFSDNNHCQLLLIGPDTDDGSHRRRIFELIADTPDQAVNPVNNIKVIGHVENIEEWYRASDLFVLPSSEEGFSNSMLEAQSCGLPALVTKISGAEELIDETLNGTFISRSPESISGAIGHYYSNRDVLRRHSENARKRILEQYASDRILEKHLQLFRTVADRG